MIKLENVHKSFGKNEVLKGINLHIEQGQVVVIIGPSGSGKSTVLRTMNYLEEPTSGKVIVDGMDLSDKKKLNDVRAEVGMVFQNFNLFPHMTVMENLTLAQTKVRKTSMEEAKKIGQALLDRVGLADKANAYPDSLSGGQKQRVAIARAIAKKPRVLLLDEPLSNLDARLRLETREEIRRIQQETGITTIFVTHDQEEAMSITDAIVLMKDGVLQQKEAPQEMYRKPANQFVASFMGTPPMGFMNGKVENGKVFIGSSILGDAEVANGDVVVGVRPESWRLSQEEGINATVKMVEVIGRDKLMTVDIEGQSVRCLIDSDNEVNVSDVVKLTVKPQAIHVFDTTSGHRLG